jgi:hypothetical protein
MDDDPATATMRVNVYAEALRPVKDQDGSPLSTYSKNLPMYRAAHGPKSGDLTFLADFHWHFMLAVQLSTFGVQPVGRGRSAREIDRTFIRVGA